MGANLHKTKRRIASVTSTKKITKAMELVATTKLKRYKNALLSSTTYFEKLDNISKFLFSKINSEKCSYTNYNEGQKDVYIVINSNLGLCGSFNNDVAKYVENNIKKDNSVLYIIGLKGEKRYLNDYQVDTSYISTTESMNLNDIDKLSKILTAKFINKEVRSINIIYTKFINALRFEPETYTLFPIKINETVTNLNEPILDPNADELVKAMLPLYASQILYVKLVESQVSEQASRRNAMENATDNASEIIDTLVIEYNKERQAMITSELTDLASATFSK